MIENIFIYNPYSNQTVTEFYLRIIEQSCTNLGINVEYGNALKKQHKDKKVAAFVISPEDVVRAKRKGYYPVIVWSQGIVPEESYMRHKSILRKIILSYMEVRGLRSADAVFMVSEQMKRHYQKKYGLNTIHSFIMPCFDQDINQDAFFTKGKYSNNVFLYAGGLQIWQCFEKTVALYEEIEREVPNAFFRVLTKDVDQAEAIIHKHMIKNYSIGFVPHEQIARELQQAKFGFAIRDNDVVNRVSTPTKLSTYIANGVMPIYSSYVESFHEKAKHSNYCFDVSEDINKTVKSIIDLCKKDVDPAKVFKDYNLIFGDYFSSEDYVKKIALFFEDLFR